ncbi:MAG: hypothetical protein HY020_10600 [Burkholderiales bacterium]|nr:hypothetical protein [Burkholderiales bacterium]
MGSDRVELLARCRHSTHGGVVDQPTFGREWLHDRRRVATAAAADGWHGRSAQPITCAYTGARSLARAESGAHASTGAQSRPDSRPHTFTRARARTHADGPVQRQRPIHGKHAAACTTANAWTGPRAIAGACSDTGAGTQPVAGTHAGTGTRTQPDSCPDSSTCTQPVAGTHAGTSTGTQPGTCPDSSTDSCAFTSASTRTRTRTRAGASHAATAQCDAPQACQRRVTRISILRRGMQPLP